MCIYLDVLTELPSAVRATRYLQLAMVSANDGVGIHVPIHRNLTHIY